MSGYKIAEARIAKGWSQQDLAEKMDTTQQTIQRYESGSRDIKSSVLIKLSAVLGVTISYLLGMENTSIPNNDMVEVPLYGAIAAGTPIEMIPVENSQPVPSEVRRRYPSAFLLKVEGDSMNRILPNGCYALVDPCEAVEHNGAPYAVCVNGYDATIKRVNKLNNGFELAPDSNDPTYSKQVFNYNEPGTQTITVIGEVVYFVLPFDWEF
ncbi:XRE family transcriptional regulator [Slackia isoflavoniconvertens]|uniref:LexA family protein n=1 Tax=Slackia isoflavoniconvertens TaxID=572010 RepID=UPI003079F9F9